MLGLVQAARISWRTLAIEIGEKRAKRPRQRDCALLGFPVVLWRVDWVCQLFQSVRCSRPAWNAEFGIVGRSTLNLGIGKRETGLKAVSTRLAPTKSRRSRMASRSKARIRQALHRSDPDTCRHTPVRDAPMDPRRRQYARVAAGGASDNNVRTLVIASYMP